MKRIKFIFFAIGLATFMTSCTENYSNGERIGMITKFSEKGLVYDSWEGTLNTTQTGMNSATPFEFSVDNDVNDPVVISILDSAATNGWKVKIKYHETFGKNWFGNRGETNYFVKEVVVLDKNPLGSMFGTNKTKSDCDCKTEGKVIDTIYVVIDKTK
jgi:hypothetical protein